MGGADSAAGWKALAELQYQNRCADKRKTILLPCSLSHAGLNIVC